MKRDKNKEIGDRLRSIRERCGLTRKEVELQTNGEIKSASLSTFENNQSQISLRYLKVLLDFYRLKGVRSSYDWVISGDGMQPIEHEGLASNITAVKESAYFLQNNQNSKIITATTNRFSPYIKTGDFIGIIKRDSFTHELKLYTLLREDTPEFIFGKKDKETSLIYYIDRSDIVTQENVLPHQIYEVIWVRKQS
ncbi:helix-turn-helix transcriptional regulator [Serratia marcescens]|uniref:helix-turn-helix domain-containing protein n=1 Tax=Serratia marcescens TaxID=615 RepID=UPI0015D88207|nr:helix-turn-helix transcriptional regulator [Serratia marcescens]MBL5824306.1 helix-turn-helix transcriptional regulator [Serratia marcescens]QLJ63686.1 helix-turn-helix transcriptional regulator [Serratia marcescens]